MKLLIRLIIILSFTKLLFVGCQEAKSISKEKFTRDIESLTKYQIAESQVNFRYYVLADSLKKYLIKGNICERLNSEVREAMGAFFRDSFFIENRPVLYYLEPSDCNLNSCLPDNNFENCSYHSAFLTGYTQTSFLENAKGLLKKLIQSDNYSIHRDRYRARFKIHFFMEFSYETRSNKPICEVTIDTRFYLMLQDRKNHEGKWIPADKNDNFIYEYDYILRDYFNKKLKDDYNFL